MIKRHLYFIPNKGPNLLRRTVRPIYIYVHSFYLFLIDHPSDPSLHILF